MKTRQNRWNGGFIGQEAYLDGNGLLSASENYVRKIGMYVQGLTATPYVRPSEWVSLPSITAGQQMFAGVFAVYNNDSNFVAFTVAGNYTVDWGDGTTGSFSSGVAAYKRYDKTTYSGLTSSVYENYKTLVITITPTGAANLTSINLTTKHNQSNLSTYNNQWLDIRIAGSNLTSINIGTAADPGVWPTLLEQYEFIGTNNITSMAGQFENARKLKNLILPFSYTQNATNTSGMFASCFSLEQIPDLNTSNVTNPSSMFSSCFSLLKIPNSFNTSKATTTASLFQNCRLLVEIPSLDTSLVTNTNSMFYLCACLKSVPWMNTSKVTNAGNMFRQCRSLRTIPFLNFSNTTDAAGMFEGCWSLESIPPLDFSKNTNYTFMFGSCFRLQKLPPIVTSAATSMALMFAYGISLQEITFIDTSNVTSFFYTFNTAAQLRKINNLNVSKATNMQQMFAQTSSLVEIPELNFNPNLTDASQIFYACGAISLGNTFLNFPNATSLQALFQYTTTLKKVPPINAPKCLNASSMFDGCALLQSIPGITLVSGTSMASFNTSGFNSMFNNCQSLIEVPKINFSGLSGSFTSVFNTMLNNCRSLSDVSGFTGIAYNFSISGAKLSGTALNDLYNSLAVVGASGSNTRTVTVSSNWGAATDDPNIAIAKGWQVTG